MANFIGMGNPKRFKVLRACLISGKEDGIKLDWTRNPLNGRVIEKAVRSKSNASITTDDLKPGMYMVLINIISGLKN